MRNTVKTLRESASNQYTSTYFDCPDLINEVWYRDEV